MMRFLAVALLTSVSAAGSSTRLRSGAGQQPGGLGMPNRGWNLESQAVDSTQIQSPAEMEEEEESMQDVPSSLPALPVALEDIVADVAMPQALPKPVLLSMAPPAPTPPVVNIPVAQPIEKENVALLDVSIPVAQSIDKENVALLDVNVPAAQPNEKETVDVLDVNIPAAQPNENENAAVLEELAVAPVYKTAVPASRPMLRNLTKGSMKFIDGSKTELGAPKDPSIYALDEHKQCNPPCQANRGVCNDRVCFCKTPYAGTTCQDKITAGVYRFGTAIVIGSAAVSVAFGSLCAFFIYSFVRDSIEKRMVSLGDETVNKESWTPSDTGTKKKAQRK